MKNTFDIDIDVADRDKVLDGLPHISAAINEDGVMKKHNSGVYFQDIPRNSTTGISLIDHDEADELGFFKIDFLNIDVYNHISSEQELSSLMYEPDWGLLEFEDVIKTLHHLGEHSNEVLLTKPKSVKQLAMLLAMIRPSKRYLLGKPWQDVEKEVWIIPEDGSYYFKKSHAISYAMVVVIQLNLIAMKRIPII